MLYTFFELHFGLKLHYTPKKSLFLPGSYKGTIIDRKIIAHDVIIL
jgi:hypothetical protein